MKYLGIAILTALFGCNDSNNEPNSRNLDEAISFAELIEKRMEPDSSIDGETVLITSEVNAYFNQDLACTTDIRMCREEDYSTEISPPIYQGSSVGACMGYGIELTHENISEKLHIDLNEHTEFFSLIEEYNVPVNFYAQVEFVERQVWCGDQINYGIKLTLLSGEESHLLKQLN